MKCDGTFRIVEASGRAFELAVPSATGLASYSLASQSLAAVIWLSGETPPPALCSGLGRCGACRVRFLPQSAQIPEATDKDNRVLGIEAVAEGWRLACEHRPAPGMALELPPLPEPRTRHPRQAEGAAFSASLPASLRLAVDLGTTSLHWRLLGCAADGSWLSLDQGQSLNPQMGAGSDVVSRLAVALAPERRRWLRELVLNLLRALCAEAAASWGQPVAEICVAGNTAMSAILLDADIVGLAGAPYRLPHAGGVTADLPGLPPIWIPPQPAPFVGGDVSAGVAWLLHGGGSAHEGEDRKPRFPLLLADLGTNGEFVLALDARRAYLASVPLGPSLEGIGLSRGGMAAPGNVDRFSLEPGGLVARRISDGEAASKTGSSTGDAPVASVASGASGADIRICGTGYLSLLECLLNAGVLDASGRLAESATSSPVPFPPLAARLRRLVERDSRGWSLPLPYGLFLTGEDVEEILKVKAAFSLALESLLSKAGLSSTDLARVELAGALGEHVPVSALERLGFLPQGLGGRVHAAGNTSLEGAAFLLTHPEERARLSTWSRSCELVDVAGTEDFTAAYMRHMVFA